MRDVNDLKGKKVDKSTIIITIITIICALLNTMLNVSLLILIPLLFLIMLITIIVYYKIEDNKIIKYDLGMDINTILFVELFNNSLYLEKINNILGNGSEESYSNVDEFINEKINKKELIYLNNNFKIYDAIDSINELLNKKKIKYRLDVQKIIERDDSLLKKRREDNISTTLPDLTSIRYTLEEEGLELISFILPKTSKNNQADGFFLTVIELEKVQDLMKEEYKVFNNLEQ